MERGIFKSRTEIMRKISPLTHCVGMVFASYFVISTEQKGGTCMVTEQELRELTDFAQEIRIWTIRQMAERGFGHMGGAMSICDLLSVL